MKKLTKIVVFALLATFTFKASANELGRDAVSVGLVDERGKHINLEIGGKQAQLYLTDKKGEVVYHRQLQSLNENNATLDLSDLQDGKYKLSMSNEFVEKTYRIVVVNGKADVSATKVTYSVMMDLSKKGKIATLKLSALNLTPLRLDIKNEYNEVLYTEEFDLDGVCSKHFDFGKIYAGQLKFSVTTTTGQYEKVLFND